MCNTNDCMFAFNFNRPSARFRISFIDESKKKNCVINNTALNGMFISLTHSVDDDGGDDDSAAAAADDDANDTYTVVVNYIHYKLSNKSNDGWYRPTEITYQ